MTFFAVASGQTSSGITPNAGDSRFVPVGGSAVGTIVGTIVNSSGLTDDGGIAVVFAGAGLAGTAAAPSDDPPAPRQRIGERLAAGRGKGS